MFDLGYCRFYEIYSCQIFFIWPNSFYLAMLIFFFGGGGEEDRMVRFHGDPLSIISNHGTLFNSMFWKSFNKGLGTWVKLSMAFHPKIDG